MIVRRLFPFAFLILAITAAAAAGDTDAPLGLSWGMSTSDVRDRGADLVEMKDSEYGKTFGITKLERAVADQEFAYLSFGFNDKLWRIMIISHAFKNDPHGTAVLSRYNQLSDILTEKYGKPKQVHRLGDSIYSESRYFFAGIRGGNTKWFSNFETPTIFVQLGISAEDSSTGNWILFYQFKPLEKEFQSAKRAKEKGTL
jgi:hypothetical protein